MGTKLLDENGDLRRAVSLRLAIIARQLRAHYDQNAESLGVTRSQSTVIAVVASYPGATQRIIANALEISDASAGRIVDRLCSDGLLERRQKEDDRRAHAIFLTEAGGAITSNLSDVARVSEASAFAGLSDEDMKQLKKLLDKISNNLAK